MDQTRYFDYNGFQSKKEYILNKFKSLIGKGISKKELLSRKLKLQAYYKDHPDKLSERGKPESLMSFKNKLNYKPNSDIKIRKAYDKLKDSLKNTKFKPGTGMKYATKIGAPLAVAPIPGTTLISGAVIGAGAGIDKLQDARLRRSNPKYLKSVTRIKKLESSINKVDDKLNKKSKKIK